MNAKQEHVKARARVDIYDLEDKYDQGSSLKAYKNDRQAQEFLDQERHDHHSVLMTIIAHPELISSKDVGRVAKVDTGGAKKFRNRL